MQAAVRLKRFEVAARSAPRRRSIRRTLSQALRRIVRLDVFSLEDEIARAVDRAFAEFAREMRK
jgi:hypothetical protein